MNEKNKKNKVAWSDDLSYDSEEEREKERILKEVLAEIEAPEKPSYSDEELRKLISFIKQTTTLYSLRKKDWNNSCTEIITEFFMEPKCLLLSLFFKGDTLTAMLDIPNVPVYDLTYFLREPDFIFTVDNFYDEIIFGTFVESAEGSLLKVLELVYAPIFFSETKWPESVKNVFCDQLHTFLAKLTDLHYKTLGLTVLYVPREGFNSPVKESSSKEDLVQRLDKVVAHWLLQMKSCIEDHDMAPAHNELVCPQDEYHFWEYRYENLSIIHSQVDNPSIKHIVQILLISHSAYIKQFTKLCDEINKSMIEAKSNIEYLQIINEPCFALENIEDLSELPQHISKILNTFRYIWLRSPYYNTTQRLTKLFTSLSNQVIVQCSASVNLKSLFRGNTRTAMEEFRKCIECCLAYRNIYNEVAAAHNNMRPGSWDIDAELVFNYIDSFVQRCVDMLEVCNTMIIFGRIDESGDFPKPLFCGTRGEEFESMCDKNKILFHNALSKIEHNQENILNVQAESWFHNISEFMSTIEHIEILIKNLLSTIFRTINNVEEGLFILCSMYNYSKRNNLKKIFEEKTREIWSMFEIIIGEVKHRLVAKRHRYPSNLPPFSGEAMMIDMRKTYVVYHKEVLDSAVWMIHPSNARDVTKQYKELIEAIDMTMHSIWVSWTNSFDESIGTAMDRTLICESTFHVEMLECNINRNIFDFIREVQHWQNLEWEIPSDMNDVYLKIHKIRLFYENVLIIVKEYNRILSSLSDDERKLFRPLINDCKETIQPGIDDLKWNSENLDDYLLNCLNDINELRDFLDCYKRCNENIVSLLEKICDTNMIKFNYPFDAFDLIGMKKEFKLMWSNAFKSLMIMYKEILTHLTFVFEGFEEYISEISTHWLKYVKKYDILLENAICLSVKTSINNMLRVISGDGALGPQPVLKINVILHEQVVCFEPKPVDVIETFSNILPAFLWIIASIPRLHKNFNLPNCGLQNFATVIKNDPEIRRLQLSIIEETKMALCVADSHLKMWEKYQNIWMLPKKDFMMEYASQKPVAADFEKEISRFIELINDVQMEDDFASVHFILLNHVNIKKIITERCTQWQQSFSSMLDSFSERDVNDMFKCAKLTSQMARRKPRKAMSQRRIKY